MVRPWVNWEPPLFMKYTKNASNYKIKMHHNQTDLFYKTKYMLVIWGNLTEKIDSEYISRSELIAFIELHFSLSYVTTDFSLKLVKATLTNRIIIKNPCRGTYRVGRRKARTNYRREFDAINHGHNITQREADVASFGNASRIDWTGVGPIWIRNGLSKFEFGHV